MDAIASKINVTWLWVFHLNFMHFQQRDPGPIRFHFVQKEPKIDFPLNKTCQMIEMNCTAHLNYLLHCNVNVELKFVGNAAAIVSCFSACDLVFSIEKHYHHECVCVCAIANICSSIFTKSSIITRRIIYLLFIVWKHSMFEFVFWLFREKKTPLMNWFCTV